MNKKRVHVFVDGRVQGVFFREHTRREAAGRGVYGWVRNLRDGRVEAILEGDSESIDQMLSWFKQGSPASIVNHVSAEEELYTGEFNNFEIRSR